VFSEFVTGGALSDWIRSRRLYEGDESEVLARLLKIAIQFARGLAWAHRHGFVHQDVKPGNVLLADDETVKVADFGLARHLKPTNMALAPSHVAQVSGYTRPYASPEQIAGSFVTTYTDMWSWAASVLEMYLGGLTWLEGNLAPAVFQAYLARGGRERGIPSMPQVTARLVRKCLRLDSGGHPRNFDEIADAILAEYQDLFGEEADLEDPDADILRADSHNNRAVSLLDVGRDTEASRLLTEALKGNPCHFEAIYNKAMLQAKLSGQSVIPMITALTKMPIQPAHLWRHARLLASAWAYEGHIQNAEHTLKTVPLDSLTHSEQAEYLFIRMGLRNASKRLHFALAQPRSASELGAEAARFRRLLPKAKMAFAEHRTDDAKRYLLMLGDMPDYSMHTEVRALRQQLGG
jgi:serine/threonine protein kinase